VGLFDMYVDLHVHLRGTIGPSLAQRLAARHGQSRSSEYFAQHIAYNWSGFSGFLEAYDKVAGLVRTATDLEDVAYSYLAASAEQGTAYVEFMLSPPDLLRDGVPYADQLEALTSAWKRSKEEFGIESRLIVTCVRHLGPEAALKAAYLAASAPHPYVVGFGLTGDERQFDVSAFVPAFQIAKDAGLRLTAHAGEHRCAQSIQEAVELLDLDRVGHGVRATEDVSVMSFLADRGTGLEICISSNVALGLYPSVDDHPLRQLLAAGVRIALGTDDPAFFNTTPAKECMLAAQNCSLDKRGVARIMHDSIELSFCDALTKSQLRSRLPSDWP
jgi:adenosine deaminase